MPRVALDENPRMNLRLRPEQKATLVRSYERGGAEREELAPTLPKRRWQHKSRRRGSI